jgi:hypothetical protein
MRVSSVGIALELYPQATDALLWKNTEKSDLKLVAFLHRFLNPPFLPFHGIEI